ncbi:MAG: hypothetical protein AAFV53_42730 [Myxococcota bacterium]
MVVFVIALLSGCSEFELSRLGDDTREGDSGLRSLPMAEPPRLYTPPTPFDLLNPFPPGEAPVYLHSGNQLWSWSPEDDDPVFIGRFTGDFPEFDSMGDAALSAQGKLFGTTRTAIYAIDPETAETVKISSLRAPVWGLVFLRDGRLLGSGEGIYVIDPEDGSFAETLLAPNGQDETSGDLAELPNGWVYWTTLGEGQDELLVFDPDARAIVQRGLAPTGGVWGLAYTADTLFGFNFLGDFIRLDLENGSEVFDQNQPVGWSGAAGNPLK